MYSYIILRRINCYQLISVVVIKCKLMIKNAFIGGVFKKMVNQYRVEEDLIGKKEVPTSAYYGIQSIRASENFNITGYTTDSELITAIAYVKKAAALANMETGSLDDTIGN